MADLFAVRLDIMLNLRRSDVLVLARTRGWTRGVGVVKSVAARDTVSVVGFIAQAAGRASVVAIDEGSCVAVVVFLLGAWPMEVECKSASADWRRGDSSPWQVRSESGVDEEEEDEIPAAREETLALLELNWELLVVVEPRRRVGSERSRICCAVEGLYKDPRNLLSAGRMAFLSAW